jgi:transcriptional regulator with XRE-family HTH domain
MTRQAEIINFDILAERLRDERVRAGLTQDRMAKVGGCSTPTQFRYENGHPVKLDYLFRLGAAGIDVSYILTGRRSLAAINAEDQLWLDLVGRLTIRDRETVMVLLSHLAGASIDLHTLQSQSIQRQSMHSPKREFRDQEKK